MILAQIFTRFHSFSQADSWQRCQMMHTQQHKATERESCMATDYLNAWAQPMAAERWAQASSLDANGECEAAT